MIDFLCKLKLHYFTCKNCVSRIFVLNFHLFQVVLYPKFSKHSILIVMFLTALTAALNLHEKYDAITRSYLLYIYKINQTSFTV